MPTGMQHSVPQALARKEQTAAIDDGSRLITIMTVMTSLKLTELEGNIAQSAVYHIIYAIHSSYLALSYKNILHI